MTEQTNMDKSAKDVAKEMAQLMIDEDEEWTVTQSPNMGFIVMVHLHLVEMGHRSVLDPYEGMVCVIRHGVDLPQHLKDLMDEYYKAVGEMDNQEL